MTRTILATLAIALSSGTVATAQSVFNPNPPISAPYSRPALSPYLNLLRGGDPAANYYLGVMTEQDRRFQLTKPYINVEAAPRLDPYVDDRVDLEVGNRQLPPTGHSAGFMIYNSYYRLPQRGFIPYNPSASGGGATAGGRVPR